MTDLRIELDQILVNYLVEAKRLNPDVTEEYWSGVIEGAKMFGDWFYGLAAAGRVKYVAPKSS